jgi:hypothetical protein
LSKWQPSMPFKRLLVFPACCRHNPCGVADALDKLETKRVRHRMTSRCPTTSFILQHEIKQMARYVQKEGDDNTYICQSRPRTIAYCPKDESLVVEREETDTHDDDTTYIRPEFSSTFERFLLHSNVLNDVPISGDLGAKCQRSGLH